MGERCFFLGARTHFIPVQSELDLEATSQAAGIQDRELSVSKIRTEKAIWGARNRSTRSTSAGSLLCHAVDRPDLQLPTGRRYVCNWEDRCLPTHVAKNNTKVDADFPTSAVDRSSVECVRIILGHLLDSFISQHVTVLGTCESECHAGLRE